MNTNDRKRLFYVIEINHFYYCAHVTLYQNIEHKNIWKRIETLPGNLLSFHIQIYLHAREI